MAKPISAADLRQTAEPERFAAAMARCRHSGALCGQDGFCHYGDCLTGDKPLPDRTAYELAVLRQLIDELHGELLDVRSEVKELRQQVTTPKRQRAKKTPPKLAEGL